MKVKTVLEIMENPLLYDSLLARIPSLSDFDPPLWSIMFKISPKQAQASLKCNIYPKGSNRMLLANPDL